MLPLVTYGMTLASTARRPSTPWTRIVSGSTTESPSTPIRAVQDGWSAVSESLATQARISSSVSTPAPGDSSPVENGPNAGWVRIRRAVRTASTHSRRS